MEGDEQRQNENNIFPCVAELPVGTSTHECGCLSHGSLLLGCGEIQLSTAPTSPHSNPLVLRLPLGMHPQKDLRKLE